MWAAPGVYESVAFVGFRGGVWVNLGKRAQTGRAAAGRFAGGSRLSWATWQVGSDSALSGIVRGARMGHLPRLHVPHRLKGELHGGRRHAITPTAERASDIEHERMARDTRGKNT